MVWIVGRRDGVVWLKLDQPDKWHWPCGSVLYCICGWVSVCYWTQVLTEVGDKEPSFVSSKQWIGSFEVSIVLNHLLGVTSRISNVPSGADMGSMGRELLRHFEEEGTPIMIGMFVCVVCIYMCV